MTPFGPHDVPHIPRGVRLRTDEVRHTHVLLAPERAFELDPIAAAVLQLVDGTRSVQAIAAVLAERYQADTTTVEADVIAMLDDLATKRVLDR